MKTKLFALVILFILVSGHATAASPPAKPFLRLETGMHTAPINRISVDAGEKYVVTASDDKTARIWDIATGRLLKILRPPQGEGNEGKLYAVAMSPDAKTVAVGGWTKYGSTYDGHTIYLFDRSTGHLKRRIKGMPNAIRHLAFSPDGKYLVACLGGKNGVRIFNTRNWSLAAKDTYYGYSSYWADFDRHNRLVTTCLDSYIRLYDSRFKLLAQKKAIGGKVPVGARFSPDGKKIAVGFYDSTKVNVFSAKDLSLLYTPDTEGVANGELSKVSWSTNGGILYAGGIYNDGTGTSTILQWTNAGKGKHKALSASLDTIMDIQPLSGGGVLFGSRDPTLGLFDKRGKKVWRVGTSSMDLRGSNPTKLLLAKGGNVVCFEHILQDPGKPEAREKVIFDLQARELLPLYGSDKIFKPPLTEPKLLNVTDWHNSYAPKLNGKKLPLTRYEFSRCLAISPDISHFLLGTDWYLKLFDSKGNQKWAVPIPSVAWAVNVAGDGKTSVVAFGDGTIRWYDTKDGTELMAFFATRDLKKWVLWNPDGFFDAHGGGEKLVGYHLNQVAAKEGEFVTVDWLYDIFYRPELVAKSLTREGRAEIRAEVARIDDIRQVLAKGLPPVVEILSKPSGTLKNSLFVLKLRLEDRGGGIEKVVYRINGVTVKTLSEKGGGLPGIPGKSNILTIKRPVTLHQGKNEVEVTAYNKRGVASKPVRLTLALDDPLKLPPSLYVLSVGINRYRERDWVLKHAVNDAEKIAWELKKRAGRLFGKKINIKVLKDRQATLDGIKGAIEDMSRKIKPKDVFVLYLSGHGTAINGKYHFIPQDLIYRNRDSILRDSLTQELMQSLLAKIQARKSLILLDTCAAGAATSMWPSKGAKVRSLGFKGALDKLMRATGRSIIASVSAKEVALEGFRGHGVFTYALLEGVRGKADEHGNRNRLTEISELANWVDYRVPEISLKHFGYEFFPMRTIGANFPISTVHY